MGEHLVNASLCPSDVLPMKDSLYSIHCDLFMQNIHTIVYFVIKKKLIKKILN